MADIPTRLVTRHIDSFAEAASISGAENIALDGYREIPLVMKPARGCCSGYVVVPQGFAAIMVQHGRFIGVWREGLHTAMPYVQCSHLVPNMYVVYDQPIKQCPTADNVMVEVDVSLVFHILEDDEDVTKFAWSLGPERLDQLLQAKQEEAVREMARKRRYNEIYDLMDSSVDQALETTLRALNLHLREYGVEVDRLTITNVKLPTEFRDIMQNETTWASKNEYNKIEQDYEMMKIAHTETQRKHKQEVDDERLKMKSQLQQEVATAEASLATIEAETRKVLAEIAQDQQDRVREVSTSSALKVAEITQEKDITLSKIRSGADGECAKLLATARGYAEQKKAEADRVVAENDAQALKFQAEAEKIASSALRDKRLFERRMRQLHVLKALAENDKLVISGNSSDNIVAQLAASQAAGAMLGVNVTPEAGQGSVSTPARAGIRR